MSKVSKCGFVGLSAVLMLAAVNLPAVTGQAHHSPLSQAHGRLARAAEITSQSGSHAKLPPHISTLLGLSKEEEVPVMQGVVRTANLVQGIDVSVANRNDIVLFVVDETANDQTLYLASPDGVLRKVVSVKGGVGDAVRTTDEERKAFGKEKQFWVDRLVPPGAAK